MITVPFSSSVSFSRIVYITFYFLDPQLGINMKVIVAYATHLQRKAMLLSD